MTTPSHTQPSTQFAKAKQSFITTEVSECPSSKAQAVIFSDESSSSSLSSTINKPHKSNDSRWEAIQANRSRDRNLGLYHFRLFKRLGYEDIGSVHLAELGRTRNYFAIKVKDKGALASLEKLLRAQTERDILQSLDHQLIWDNQFRVFSLKPAFILSFFNFFGVNGGN